VLRHEVGVLAQTIARTLDLDDDRVVKEPVQEGGGDDGIAKKVAPLGEAAEEPDLLAQAAVTLGPGQRGRRG